MENGFYNDGVFKSVIKFWSRQLTSVFNIENYFTLKICQLEVKLEENLTIIFTSLFLFLFFIKFNKYF